MTTDPLARAVDAVDALDGVEMAFAATLDPRAATFRLGHMRGQRAGSMDGLVTEVGQGLGGKVLALERPLAVTDYARARGITHQFDQAVAAEGLRAVFAVPLRVEGHLSGAVYGAIRRPLELGERFLRGVVDAVRAAGRPRPEREVGDVLLGPEDVRELHAALRTARATAPDAAERARLDRLVERLHGSGRETGPVHLAGRELDVLASVALGASNAEVARRLGLRVETVKSYLKSAMAKLDSHTRAEAVHRARGLGLLP